MNFLNKYDNPKNIRFNSFKFALEEAFKRNLKVIVETGVSRGKQKFIFFSKMNWKDGMSSLIFSEYAKYVDGHLHACDINPKNIGIKTSEGSTYISLNDINIFNENGDILVDQSILYNFIPPINRFFGRDKRYNSLLIYYCSNFSVIISPGS